MTDNSAGTVREHRIDGVLNVVLDRPGRRNALSPDMVTALIDLLEVATSDDAVRAIRVSGAGSDFCSGVDWVSTNETAERPRAGQLARRIPLHAHRVVELVQDIQVPVVCVVRGWVAGFGLGLALAADFTVAAADAQLWAPFARRGFTPDSGTTWTTPRLIGMARAKELLMLGRPITGADAAAMGLVHRAVPEGELDEAADALVGELAAGPTGALGLTKALIHRAARTSMAEALRDEASALEIACRTADFKEGLKAFVDRREPEFRGR